MAIIDSARQPALQQQPGPAQQPQAPGRSPVSKEARSVILAVYGMLYDPRVGLGEKLAQKIGGVSDPVGFLAHTAYDLVASACEKTGIALQDADFRVAAMIAIRRLSEIAEAVGMQLSEQDGADAAQMVNERIGGGEAPAAAAQPAPEQGAVA